MSDANASNQEAASISTAGNSLSFTGTNAGVLPASLRDALDLSAFRDINIRGTSQLADYNNGDRLLNMTLRYYASTGWGALKSELVKAATVRPLPMPPGVTYLPPQTRASVLAAEYEATTTLYFQMFKARNSLATFNYNLANPAMYDSSNAVDYVMAVANTVRSGISAGVANVFAAANAVRYSPRNRSLEMIVATQGDRYLPDRDVSGDDFLTERIPDIQRYRENKAALDAVKQTRQYYNAAGFFLLGLSNATGAGLSFWQMSDAESETARTRAGLTGGAQAALTIAMAFKAASAWYSATGKTAQAASTAKAGSVFGLLNGLLSFSTFVPTLADPKATAELKGVVGADMALQVISAGFLTGGNYRLLQALQKGTSITGAVGMMSLASLMAALNPTEIYRLVKQSEYADKLDELARIFEPRGYDGDRMLSGFYDGKTAMEGGMMGANVFIALVGVAVDVAIATGAVTGGVGVVVGLVLGAVGFALSAVQQVAIEDLAEKMARDISAQGGGRAFFANNLGAVYDLLVSSEEFTSALRDWQVRAHVDSVVVGNTVTLTPTAVELAGVTRNGQRLSSALTRLERVIDGQVQQSRQVEMDAALGTIILTAAGEGEPGSQMLTFYSPLMAPGVEQRDRDKTGKNNYRTYVDLKLAEGGWKINDDATSTVFDLVRVVSTFVGRDHTSKPQAPQRVAIDVKGGAGDDTLLVGASDTRFDGGTGTDVVSYSALEQLAPLTLTVRSDGSYVVNKDLAQVKAYVEVEKTQKVVVGTRTENVEVRSVEVQVLKGNKGTDILSNVEMVIGGQANDTFTGGSGTDIFSGGKGDDLLQGLDGDDVLEGGPGSDRLVGGAGVDAASYRSAPQGIVVLLDISLPVPGDLPLALRQAVGVMKLAFASPGLAKMGRLSIALDGEGGEDRMIDVENVFGSMFGDILVGDDGENLLRGEGGNDHLRGRGGDDVLDGGAGNDTLFGGAGDDILVRGIDGEGFASLEGGEGSDTVNYAAFRVSHMLAEGFEAGLSGLRVNLGERKVVTKARFGAGGMTVVNADTLVAMENVIGSAFDDWMLGDAQSNILGGHDGADTVQGGMGNDSLFGGAGNDLLMGDENDDLLSGGDGSDTLLGGDGNDILHGGEGLNVLQGGAGSDTASYVADPLLPFLFVPPADGNGVYIDLADVVEGEVRAFHDLGADGQVGDHSRFDRLISIENLVGSGGADILRGTAAGESLAGAGGDDRIEGRAGNDVLYGNDGNDELIGGTGRDTLYGGTGEDALIRDAGEWGDVLDGGEDADVVDYSGLGQGGILVNMASGMAILRTAYLQPGAVFDRLVDIEGVIGSGAADDFMAASSGNMFDGRGGSDSLRGGVGNDMLFGGAGADLLQGGAGADTLYGGAGADVVDGGADDDFLVQDGMDAAGDVFTGGAGLDTLDYSLLDLRAVAGNTGIRADLQAGKVSKLFAGDRVFDTVTLIEQLRGSVLNDTLIGASGDDILMGDWGDDVLYGAQGNDYLSGGNGFDRVLGEDGDDWIFGDIGVGADSLDGGAGVNVLDYGSQPFTRAEDSGLPGLSLDLQRGSAAKRWLAGDVTDQVSRFQSVLGTNLADRMSGSEAGETLRGGAGQDTLLGQGGDDTLVGDADADVIDGGSGNDTLIGGSGNDSLRGGAGGDVFLQSDLNGSDLLQGDEGLDIVDYSRLYEEGETASGVVVNLRDAFAYKPGNVLPDEVRTQVSAGRPMAYVDRLECVEGVVGTAGADKLLGSADDNWLSGGAGNDSLEGWDGVDVLDGGAGDDTLVGGNGEDLLAGGTGNDLLLGGAGGDTYRVWLDAKASAATVIEDIAEPNGDTDVLWLAGDANAQDLLFNRVGNDLVIYSGASTVTVRGWWNAKGKPGTQIESFLSADAKVLGKDKIDTLISISPAASLRGKDLAFQPNSTYRSVLAKLWVEDTEGRNRAGSANADLLYGGSGSDVFEAGSGADRLFGAGGDDKFLQDDLVSADTIDGGAGVDIVVYTGLPAYGGVAVDLASQTARKRDAVGVTVSTDRLQGIEGLVGSLFDDELAGDAGNNILEGGRGNDILRGRQGNDTYLFNGSFGNDILYEDGLTSDSDLMLFGADIGAERLWFERRGNDLRILVAGTQDSVSVPSWFQDARYRTERIVAGDRVLMSEQVGAIADLMSGVSMGAVGAVAPLMTAGLQASIGSLWRPLQN